jgi:hypothetical protein
MARDGQPELSRRTMADSPNIPGGDTLFKGGIEITHIRLVALRNVNFGGELVLTGQELTATVAEARNLIGRGDAEYLGDVF